jgi:hypothetical protein
LERGVEIINKSKPKKAPFVYEPPPAFKNRYEEDKYWDTWLERCHEGYNGLTGRHYAYLTIGSVKTVSGQIIRPYWRDGDQQVFEHSDYARYKTHEDEMIVKRREFGLTSIYGGFEPIYNCLINPGSINLLTSADKFRTKGMFSSKTMVMYENLILPERDIPKQNYTRVDGFLSLSHSEGKSLSGSEVWCLETADSDLAAKKLESFRAMSIFLDELFLHPRAAIVHSSAQASVMQGFKKVGHIVMGGSCGAETEAEVAAMRTNSEMVERLWRDAKNIGVSAIFLPGTLCIDEAPELDDDGYPTGKIVKFMENGYSDQEKAKEWILKQRAKLERAEDKTRFYTFVKNYPLTIDEVFDINKMGVLPPDIYAALDAAKRKIHETGQPKSYVVRRDSETGKPEKIESNKGKVIIVKDAEPNKTYISGTDPIPFGDRDLDDGSDYAIAIKCIEDQEYVAVYAERNLDSDYVIGTAIALQQMYPSSQFPNGAPTMMEANRGEVAMKLYKDSGNSDLLADRPNRLGIIYHDKKSKKGWNNNDKTGPRANNYFIQFLRKYADRIKILRIISECMAFPKGNTDVVDAIKSCEVFEKDIEELDKKRNKTGQKVHWVQYIEVVGGKTVRKFKKIISS